MAHEPRPRKETPASPSVKVAPIPLADRLAWAMEEIEARQDEFRDQDRPSCVLEGYGCESEAYYSNLPKEKRPPEDDRSLGRAAQGGLCDWCQRGLPTGSLQAGIKELVKAWLDSRRRLPAPEVKGPQRGGESKRSWTGRGKRSIEAALEELYPDEPDEK